MTFDQLIYRSQSSQLDGVVLVGLAFDIFEHPSIFVGTADDNLQAQVSTQVTDPTAGPASFHDNQVRLVGFKQCFKETTIGRERFKLLFLGLCIVCLLYTSPSPRDATLSRMPSSA